MHGTDEKKFSDTPTVLFLLFVMVTGFFVEALRISAIDSTEPYLAVEFVGYFLAILIGDRSATLMSIYDPLCNIPS